MIFSIAILSPHGWFGQSDVLGRPDIGVLNWRAEPVRQKPRPRIGKIEDDGWRFAGYFDMPWGAVIER